MSRQNDFDSIQGLLERSGSLAAFETEHGCGPNAYMIRCESVKLINGQLPKAVRAELMRAVKSGRLGRIAKSKLKPEVFFHPNAKGLAKAAQEREFMAGIESLKKVFALAEDK